MFHNKYIYPTTGHILLLSRNNNGIKCYQWWRMKHYLYFLGYVSYYLFKLWKQGFLDERTRIDGFPLIVYRKLKNAVVSKKWWKQLPSDLVLRPCLLLQYMVVSTRYRIIFQVTWRTTPAFLRSPAVTWNQRHTFQWISILTPLAESDSLKSGKQKINKCAYCLMDLYDVPYLLVVRGSWNITTYALFGNLINLEFYIHRTASKYIEILDSFWTKPTLVS